MLVARGAKIGVEVIGAGRETLASSGAVLFFWMGRVATERDLARFKGLITGNCFADCVIWLDGVSPAVVGCAARKSMRVEIALGAAEATVKAARETANKAAVAKDDFLKLI